jgi:alkyldihydroxyacetonephosphate synthase
LTLRHFPQSFEHSTLGGWIATRSGGHFATLYTHIDDLVESLRVVTPAGVVESRRLPGSGAGPSPDRLFIGSEGGLGVITEAWMRVRRRPRFRAAATARFSDFLAGAEAVRALAQSGLHSSNCRLIDAAEAAAAGSEGEGALLVLGFESADHPVATAMARALELVSDHGGAAEYDAGAGSSAGARSGAAGSWRRSFLRAPYYREELTRRAVIADTFETAITWDRFEALYRGVTERMLQAIAAATGRTGTITCRFTHVYPDGPAPYFSFRALGGSDSMLDQWREIKAAANAAVVELGGTVTHHHAVGRDHRPGYQRQCPPLFAEALRAVKRTLDPAGILNPGVLIDPYDRPVGVTGAMRAGAMRAE